MLLFQLPITTWQTTPKLNGLKEVIIISWVVLVQHISSEYQQIAADAEIMWRSDKTVQESSFKWLVIDAGCYIEAQLGLKTYHGSSLWLDSLTEMFLNFERKHSMNKHSKRAKQSYNTF